MKSGLWLHACRNVFFYVTSTPLLNLTVRMNLQSKSKHSRLKCLQVYFKIVSRIVNTFLEMSGQVWRVGNEGQNRGWTGKHQSRDKRRKPRTTSSHGKYSRFAVLKNPQLCHLLQCHQGQSHNVNTQHAVSKAPPSVAQCCGTEEQMSTSSCSHFFMRPI